MERGTQTRGESIFGLARQLIGGVVGLARLEVRHGREELGQMASSLKGGAIWLALAAAFGLLTIIALLVFIIDVVAALTTLPDYLIALIAFVILALLTTFFAFRGVRRISHAPPGPPKETIESVKEDITWVKRLLRRD